MGKSLDHYLEDKSIIMKKFGKGIEGRKISDARGASWSSRQQDLYNGERRFIFAADTEQTGLKWISKINKAIANYKVDYSPPKTRENIKEVY